MNAIDTANEIDQAKAAAKQERRTLEAGAVAEGVDLIDMTSESD